MTATSEVGFDEIYGWYCEHAAYPELYKTELIKETARIMYTMGMMTGLGIFKGVKSHRGVTRRIKQFKARLEAELADTEREKRIANLSPADFVGRRVHIEFQENGTRKGESGR